MQKWIIECWPLNLGPDFHRSYASGLFYVEARTADQLSNFAVLVDPNLAMVSIKKTTDGRDFFTLLHKLDTNDIKLHETMNVVGQIEYVGEWPAGWKS